ncbi:unnamed protein product [Urochloa humidicola]
MPHFSWQVIEADTIDEAVQRILEELKEDNDTAATGGNTTSSSRLNVIYFDGWDGLGASAVFREVGRRLTIGQEFSKIFHIDCFKWESRRAMQRMIAEQLELPTRVMDMLDAQDEEDDYQGIAKSSRAEITQVAGVIYQHIQKLNKNRRFLVIFHNGSNEEIDLDSFSFPLSGYLGNMVLWSFQGRFRLYPRVKVDRALALQSTRSTTDVVLSASSRNLKQDRLTYIMRHEAEDVAREMMNNSNGIDWPVAASSWFLYMIKLCGMGGHLIDYDLATHGCNYWKCDGFIQLQEAEVGTDVDAVDRLWLSSDALEREMRLDADYLQSLHLPSPMIRRLHEHIACWTSPTYGSTLVLDQNGRIPKGMFQQHDKLCVLKLSACMFSFESPPFLCCHSLRFLWLNHCRDDDSSTNWVENHLEDSRQFFQRLWVLDMRYSSSTLLAKWIMDFMTQLRELNVMGQDTQDMGSVQQRLNVRKLRVTKSRANGVWFSASANNKMELLDFSGNSGYKELYAGRSCSSLETVIIDGSSALEVISLNGCAKLKILLLSGLFPQLYRLDITGTAVKTLDLGAVEAPKLDQLFLHDCGKLCAILWPPQDKRKRYLGKLGIGTTRKDGSIIVAAARGGRTPTEFDWRISARDARLLGSLVPVKDYFGPNMVGMEISTTTTAGGNRADRIKRSSGERVQGNLQQLKESVISYADVSAGLKDTEMHQRAGEGDDDVWAIMWACPAPPRLQYEDCYMHIEDQIARANFQASITVPGFMCDNAKILHVHNSLSVTSIIATPLGSSWNQLEWCRVERCPKLECIFSPQVGEGSEGRSSGMETIKKLTTIWASHLPNARYVLEYPGKGPTYIAFANLKLLHLYCCPRMVYAIPLSSSSKMTWESLETLEIMWCGDLNGVIEDYTGISRHIFIGFPRLKHIHLHELPMLRGILNISRFPICAPYLETVKIRGCWSLKTLPFDVGGGNNQVDCDCEQEWWNGLKWRSREHASHYKPIHPRHYKKTMLRGPFLR